MPAASCSMLFGTSHQGLRITPTAVALSCGVGVESLPAIARCFQRLTPFSTSVAWKPGHVDDDIFRPEVARQPAPAVHVQADAVELRRLASSESPRAPPSAPHIAGESAAARPAPRGCCAERAPSEAAHPASAHRGPCRPPTSRSAPGFFTWPSARSEERRLNRSVAIGEIDRRIAASGSRPRVRQARNRPDSSPPCRPAGCNASRSCALTMSQTAGGKRRRRRRRGGLCRLRGVIGIARHRRIWRGLGSGRLGFDRDRNGRLHRRRRRA